MYDKLIKRLRETSVDFGESDDVSVMMIEAANAIEDLITALTASNEVIAKNKPKWIPVTELLPEESGSYLIANGRTVVEAYYGKEWAGGNWTDPVEMYMTFHPTHWMPLPQPPESDGE